MNTVLSIIAIQPHEFVTGDNLTGGLSAHRARAIRRAVRKGEIPRDSTMIFPQGYQENYPDAPIEREESFAKNMERYCTDKPEFAQMRIVAEPRSWSTLHDILATYTMVKQLPDYEGKALVHFATDKAHMRRVKLVWWMTHPKGWEAKFFTTDHRMSVKARLIREPVAYMIYFFKLLLRLLLR